MTAAIPTLTNDDSPEPCGPSCIYIDGFCRCYHGEYVAGEFGAPFLAPY